MNISLIRRGVRRESVLVLRAPGIWPWQHICSRSFKVLDLSLSTCRVSGWESDWMPSEALFSIIFLWDILELTVKRGLLNTCLHLPSFPSTGDTNWPLYLVLWATTDSDKHTLRCIQMRVALLQNAKKHCPGNWGSVVALLQRAPGVNPSSVCLGVSSCNTYELN